MERHFMSREGAVAVLVTSRERLRREQQGAKSSGDQPALQRQIDSLGKLILDVRAARVSALEAHGIEIMVKD